MVRKKPGPHKKQAIEWRSHEPNRLETFSDAVFAFALTLIVLSIEVPKSFDELFEMLKGTLSFAACFTVLFQIWNYQNVYFRRFGLNDRVTLVLNGILLFVILVYVYPMKFLALVLFGSGKYVHDGHTLPMISSYHQTLSLMLLYGAGYTIIYLLFYLMYLNARSKAVHLELTPKEIFETNTVAGINLLSVMTGILAMAVALILPERLCGLSGFVYFLIAICYSVWYSYRGKKGRMLFDEHH
jgi:uncharacterized membrane protein